MTTSKKEMLVSVLKASETSVPGMVLARRLGVSERTIRNYVNAVNEEGSCHIAADHNGYRLDQNDTQLQTNSRSEMEERTYHVLSKLLGSRNGVAAFDAAAELHVSESTINNAVIPEIKKIAGAFDLKIESHNYVYYLVGSERSKRRLIGHLVTTNSYGFFTSSDTLEKLYPEYDIRDMLQGLYDITQQSNLFLNNYALNNLLIHLMVILIRLKSKDQLPPGEMEESVEDLLQGFDQKDEIIGAADNLSSYFMEKYDVAIPPEDYRQIVLLIALSIDHGLTSLETIVDADFINDVSRMLSLLSERYGTPAFSNEFVLQFSLHMYQARQRCEYHVSYPNPIASQIKQDYAPVYDMAVYFAHQFSKTYSVDLSEDEIAFIAFHIGAYLENNQNRQDGISCVIVIENYHDFTSRMVGSIRRIFGEEITEIEVLTLDRYILLKPACDLLITAVHVDMHHPHAVSVDPILTKQNIMHIWSEVEAIQEEKNHGEAKIFLKSLLHKELYFRNVPFDDKTACIQWLGLHCEQQHYIRPGFVQDVLLRESVSSTAFTDCLAVPHTISQNAERSFIAVLHNDVPVSWGKRNVNFVLMIGITAEDMKYFKDSFEIIVEQFYDPKRTEKLLRTNTFEEFCNVLAG